MVLFSHLGAVSQKVKHNISCSMDEEVWSRLDNVCVNDRNSPWCHGHALKQKLTRLEILISPRVYIRLMKYEFDPIQKLCTIVRFGATCMCCSYLELSCCQRLCCITMVSLNKNLAGNENWRSKEDFFSFTNRFQSSVY